ncbi:MAG: glycosyltransferase [Alphaproteobacteria bacterium]|nr:glycosyltransferase [Alphaproteobacteria bacterium]
MKIANLIVTSVNGGAEQVFLDYTRLFTKLGHEVVPIIKCDAPYADKLSKPYKISNHFGYHDFFAIKKIAKILVNEKIEVVFAHAGRAVVLARKAIAKIRNRKIFLVAINHSYNVKRSIGADIIFSVNKQIFFKTIDAGQPENASFVMHNAVDISDAITDSLPIGLTQKKQIILGVIGRLDRTKGFQHAVRALKNLDEKFILRIAGSGAHEAALRSLVRELKLENRVEFLGWVDKKEFFQAIDIFLFTSDEEPFGLVLLESMKYRKPIIASKVDGPNEILRDGIDALMFADPKKIPELVLRLVNEENLVNQLVVSAFARLQEKFTFKSLENRLAEIVGNSSEDGVS